jgi:hypothetical protein
MADASPSIETMHMAHPVVELSHRYRGSLYACAWGRRTLYPRESPLLSCSGSGMAVDERHAQQDRGCRGRISPDDTALAPPPFVVGGVRSSLASGGTADEVP